MQRHSEDIKISKYVAQAVSVTKFFLTAFTFQWMAGRPGLIGVSVLVLAEEEHLQGFDLVLPKVGVNPAKDQAWRTKTATLKSAQVSKTYEE